jgi:hypothetical protein
MHPPVYGPHERFVGIAQRLAGSQVFRLVGDIPGHANDVLGASARLREHLQDVGDGLPALADKAAVCKAALRIPADLAGDGDQRAACGDAV